MNRMKLRADGLVIPSDRTWSRLVEATLATYSDAHGPDDAVRRLRGHLPDWPTPALHALSRIAGEGGRL